MSNASTVRRQVAGTQQLTLANLLASVISTTATAFQLNNNALTGVGGGVIPLSAGNTGLYAGTGQELWLHASGGYTGAASTSLTLQLYQIPASLLPIANTLAGAQTFTNWNAFATSGSLALSGTSGSWTIDAYIQLDAFGNVDGSYTMTLDNATVVSPVKITRLTGLVGEADLNFAVVATLATPATTVLTMNEFELSFV